MRLLLVSAVVCGADDWSHLSGYTCTGLWSSEARMANASLCEAAASDGGFNAFSFSSGLCHLSTTGEDLELELADSSRLGKEQSQQSQCGFLRVVAPVPNELSLQLDLRPIFATHDPYVCWNIDGTRDRQFFDRDLTVQKPFGAQIASYARAISDAQGYSVLRFGGTGNDHMFYLFGDFTECPTAPHVEPSGHEWIPECLNKTWWDNLNGFADAANARILFAISDVPSGPNSTVSGPSAGLWNSSNAEAILRYSVRQGYSFFGLELGNEKSSSLIGADQADQFATLQGLAERLYPSNPPPLYGPDMGGAAAQGHLPFLASFLDRARARGVRLAGVTTHEYASLQEVRGVYNSPLVLDRARVEAQEIASMVQEHYPDAMVVAGEIGPHGGGHGSGTCVAPGRWGNFADSFWYADALGSKARHGTSLFCRQDLIGIDYGLLDCQTGRPLPDFYIALQFARSMGPRVLDVPQLKSAQGLRLYAHCGRSGGVSILALNLNNTEPVTLNLPGLTDSSRKEFHFTAGPGGPESGSVALNERVLDVGADGALPAMPARTAGAGPVSLQPSSIVFVDFQHATCTDANQEIVL